MPDHSAPSSGTWESLVGGSIAKLGGRVVFKVGGALGDGYDTLKRRVEAKGGLDDLISGGVRRSADEVNATFPEGYSPPYTPRTQVTEFVSDGNQTFVRVVSGVISEGQWVMKASDIEGLSPQQIADNFALPEVPTGITSAPPCWNSYSHRRSQSEFWWCRGRNPIPVA